MDRSPDNLDDARLLPRFRARAQLIEAQRRALHDAAMEASTAGETPKLPERPVGGYPNPRGIPLQIMESGRPTVGGTSPHTQPEMETIRKLMREAA